MALRVLRHVLSRNWARPEDVPTGFLAPGRQPLSHVMILSNRSA